MYYHLYYKKSKIKNHFRLQITTSVTNTEILYACLVGQMNNYFAQFRFAIPDVTETEIAQLRILVNVISDGLDRNVTNVFVYPVVLTEIANIHFSVIAMKDIRACFVINVST